MNKMTKSAIYFIDEKVKHLRNNVKFYDLAGKNRIPVISKKFRRKNGSAFLLKMNTVFSNVLGKPKVNDFLKLKRCREKHVLKKVFT